MTPGPPEEGLVLHHDMGVAITPLEGTMATTVGVLPHHVGIDTDIVIRNGKE